MTDMHKTGVHETPRDPRRDGVATVAPVMEEHAVEPVFAPWDGRRVPVTLLSGYLGAGKTTVLNELLARTDRPIAVLVNDVGEVNIDAALIARKTNDTIELTDGCVCCSMINGFVEAFDQLRQRETPPDHVVVELSGVAEPLRAAPWAGTVGFRLDGIIVLVDAEQFTARADDGPVGDIVRNQVRAADLLVVTKRDLVDDDQLAEVHEMLAALAPDTPVLSSSGAFTAAALLDIGTRRPGGVAAMPNAGLFDAHETATITVPDPVSRAELVRILDQLGEEMVRAKGVFNLEDGSTVLVQCVGRRHEITELPPAEDQAPTPLVTINVRGL